MGRAEIDPAQRAVDLNPDGAIAAWSSR